MSTAFPSSLLTKLKRLRLDLNENKAMFESVLTRKRQVVSLSGGTADRWEGVLETVPLIGTDVRTMWAFLHQVGESGEWTVKEADYTGAQSGIASALVNGAGQSGTSLACDGVTPSVTVLRAGEYFQVGTEFKVVTADCSSNGSGQFTVSFKPALRASPADNATVTMNTPQMLVILLGSASKETDAEGNASFALAFQESI
jgi:hypothetical protein